MPHIDEWLGVATISAAGLFASVALQPSPQYASGRSEAPVASVAAQPAAAIVRLPAVNVVARKSVELARIEREDRLARGRSAKDTGRPGA